MLEVIEELVRTHSSDNERQRRSLRKISQADQYKIVLIGKGKMHNEE